MAYHVPGPCTLEFDGYDIGVTKAGVIIRPNTSLVPITDDGRGTEPGTFLFGGKSCVIEVIGLSALALKDADVWDGGVLQLNGDVGALASDGAAPLIITERNGSDSWDCMAFPIDPREFMMKSTQELQMPLTFMVIIDASTGKLFSNIPTYML